MSSIFDMYVEEAYFHNDDDILFENIDLKGSIKSVLGKIKTLIVRAIDKINNLLSKGKDNKIKSFLKDLLGKFKNLLTKTKSYEDKYYKEGDDIYWDTFDDDDEDIKVLSMTVNEYIDKLSLVAQLVLPSRFDTLSTDDLKNRVNTMLNDEDVSKVYAFEPSMTNKYMSIGLPGETSSTIKFLLNNNENQVILLGFNKDRKLTKIKKIEYQTLSDNLKQAFDKSQGWIES